jgi:RNA polymerase sigma factor (sigma-70 family)
VQPPPQFERDALIAQIVPDYRRWLGAVARDICGPANARFQDDLVQEGYIAMWRAVGSFNPDAGAAPTWLTNAARMRMTDIARRRYVNWFGKEATRGHQETEAKVSIEALAASDEHWEHQLLRSAELVELIGEGYHEGDIAAAMATLTPAERRYVYARFWLGLDPTARSIPRELLTQVPELAQRWLWTRAKVKLRFALAHLESV